MLAMTGIIKKLLLVSYIIFAFMLCSCSTGQKDADSVSKKDAPHAEWVSIKAEAVPMFVTLMFHEISDRDVKGTTRVSRSKFEKILKYLSDNKYHFLSAGEVHDFLTKKTPIPEKSIWLTFDDGLRSAHRVGTSLLKKYNAKATAFVEVKQIGDDLRLTERDLKAMAGTGIWDIQSHGYNGHDTTLTDEKGRRVNFYFNKLLIGDIMETKDDYRRRIKKDIEKSFDFLEQEFGGRRYFFAYPMDGTTSEDSEEIRVIESCLDELNIIGMGVNGDSGLPTDWSSQKHKYTRYGVKNESDIEKILSIKNIGKRIYITQENNKFTFSNIASYFENKYAAWDNNGNFVLLDERMRPLGNVFNITKSNKKEYLFLRGKTSVAAQNEKTIWVSNWDDRKLLEVDNNWVVKKEYDLNITPVSIWVNAGKLFISDTAGNIYVFSDGFTSLQFKLKDNIACSGASANANIAYISDFTGKKIYKVDYINRSIIGVKKHEREYIITPHIADKDDEFIANEEVNDVLIRVKY